MASYVYFVKAGKEIVETEEKNSFLNVRPKKKTFSNLRMAL